MNSPQAFPMHAEHPPATAVSAARGLYYMMPLALALLFAAWLATRYDIYRPGDNVGYYLGVTGGIMMLTLLLYPLRKHIGFMRHLGAVRHWFRIHMMIGIFGPLLIVVHSGFGIGSLNAAVAMFCMLLVAGSGVIGRFIYARIHHGLYGRKSTLDEMQADLGMHSSEVRSKFHFAPPVEERLKAYSETALRRSPTLLHGMWKFLTLAPRARWCRARCRNELRKALGRHAAQRGWDRAKLRHRLKAADAIISSYLEAARHTAQFSAYDRMFALWHILHVPFVFMLVISGIIHVIAVHMY